LWNFIQILRDSVYENLLQEIIMTFSDEELFKKHLEEQFTLMSDIEENSSSSLRYYDIGYNGYVRFRKGQEFPFNRAQSNVYPSIKIMVERHHDYRIGIILLEY
jgi:site-specific DNA-adenine methylase